MMDKGEIPRAKPPVTEDTPDSANVPSPSVLGGDMHPEVSKGVCGECHERMAKQQAIHTAERISGNARRFRNAKSLCDSGLSTPLGDARFSSLLTVTPCKGSSGHVVGPDFIRGDIPILNSSRIIPENKDEPKEVPSSSGTGNLKEAETSSGASHERRKTEYVGAVTFNQSYISSPSSLMVCTACNRTDYKDRATNVGLACAYTHPPFSKSIIPGQKISVESASSFLWKHPSTSARNVPLLTSMSPLTSRAYVSKRRVCPPKEMDTMELGDPMCIRGSSYGLTYLGASKINGLTCEVYDPNVPLKRRTVRYSVSKLLRRSLPDLLSFGKGTEQESSGTESSSPGGVRTWWKPFYVMVFCSFERTRTFLDNGSQSTLVQEAYAYIGKRLMNHMIWICQTIEFRKTRQMKEDEEAGISREERLCSCRTSQIVHQCSHMCDSLIKTRMEERLKQRYGITGDPYDTTNAFYHWRESFDDSPNPPPGGGEGDWKGPWYKSTQTMDEDEMSFFNLDLRYITEVYQWCTNVKESREAARGYSVVATLLLKLYVVNDVMRALSPTRREHRMPRLLLQMFADQMLDLHNWISSSCSPPIGHLRRCRYSKPSQQSSSWNVGLITDTEILQSPSERGYSFPTSGKELRTGANMWKEHVRGNPETMVRPYDEYYPHGRRFVWAGELPSLGHLFCMTDLWNKHRQSSGSMACLINHVACCKTQPHRCQIRSLSTVIDENKDDSASLIYLILDIVFVHLLGMYSTAIHRPCWRARGILRAQFLEFATRDRKDIVGWIRENQHVVYNAMRAHMYHQMTAIPSLRAIFLETSWQLENEMASKKVADFTRAILSDRLAYGPEGLSSLIVTQKEFNNARDVTGIDQELLDRFGEHPRYISQDSAEYERLGFRTRPRYCPHPALVRQMIYPHMLQGYRKRLHMAGADDETADWSRDSMTNQGVFSLVDMMNGESLIKCRDFQTKLRKGKFWEQLQTKIIKYISGNCAYVLNLGVWERMQACETTPREKEKLEKSMIKEIASYASSVFSVTECDGILSGNHIRAIKAVAMQAAKESEQDGVMNMHWLIPLGVSLGTIAYLRFLYYAYEYHDLPDNRLRNDVHYLVDKTYQKPRSRKKSKAKNPRKKPPKKRARAKAVAEARGDPQASATKLCYGKMKIPYEPWMDYSIVKTHASFAPREGEEEDPAPLPEADPSWLCGLVKDKQMHAVMQECSRLRRRQDGEETEDSSCSSTEMGFYADDEEDYSDEDIQDEVTWRHERVRQALGRKPTVGEMDIGIICMFFHFYEHSKFFQTVPLTRTIARNQVRALRCRAVLMPYQETPSDIGFKRFCGCGRIFDPLVAGPEYITSMYSKGELAAYDLIRKVKRCLKGTTRFCDKPPMVIDMVGRAARIGKTWYVICVICGSLTIWRKESYCELGPTCGCHAAPIRPPSKYPMAFVALTDREDVQLRQHLLDQGMLMNGWIYCGYCKETIIPGKEVNIRVWDDTLLPSSEGEEKSPASSCFTRNLEEHEEWGDSKGVERVAKTERCRLSVMTLCRDHLKHIGWSIRRHKIYSKKRLLEDLMAIVENKMKRSFSSRVARAK